MQHGHFPFLEQTRVRKKKTTKVNLLFLGSPVDIAGVPAFTHWAPLVDFREKLLCVAEERGEKNNTMQLIRASLKTFQLLICLDTQNTAGLQCITTAVMEQGFRN